jgi:hypothetical protein
MPEAAALPGITANKTQAEAAQTGSDSSNKQDSGDIDTGPKGALLEEFVDRRIVVTVCALLGLLSLLTLACLVMEWTQYHQAIEIAIKQSPPDHAAGISYARALDAAIVKTSSLMLAFIVVFVGALYVLRTTSAAFNLGLAGQGFNGTLTTSSPGLVMITLGLIIVAIAVLSQSDINYNAPVTEPDYAATKPATDNNEQIRGTAMKNLKLKPAN